FVNDTATTEIYTLSLHDPLPISAACRTHRPGRLRAHGCVHPDLPSLRSHYERLSCSGVAPFPRTAARRGLRALTGGVEAHRHCHPPHGPAARLPGRDH